MTQPRSTLTWVQPADLLAHELVASAAEGKDVDDVRRLWLDAGGSVDPPVGGAGAPVADSLVELALDLLDDLDARPVPSSLAAAEPDDLDGIRRTWHDVPLRSPGDDLADRVHGAWVGRAAGCLLGKPVEKIPREGIREILRSQGRWPLQDWFTAEGLPADVAARWPWNRRSRPTSLAENIDGMPEDDDLNFAMLALALVEQHGDDLTTDDVAAAWLADLPAGRVFTAERVAYRNLLLGYAPPVTATRHNPFRDWIGAMIRADAYGWTHPGDPAGAAVLAHADARLSHVRNGVYGAMFAAAACAAALVASSVADVLAAGLAVVPPGSRLAGAVRFGMDLGRSAVSSEDGLDALHERYGDLHWVHVLDNAALAAYALTVGDGDLGRSIAIAVTGGWDTDSVGATVGSVCGALTGYDALPSRWVRPLRNRVASTLPGFDGIGFDVLAERTLAVARSRRR